MKKTALFLMIFLTAFMLSAQKKESLALFPFTGGNLEDGETIVSSLTRQRVLRDAFNEVTLVTPQTIATMNFEQRFQRDSGMTDADTIFELGKALNAAYVIAGNITRFGDRNLVIVSVMDVESLQQIAGDYRTYRNIEEIHVLIPQIAQKLAASIMRDTSNLPGLSDPPFNISRDVDQNTAMVLAQILACDLANGDRYAVLPRTDSLEMVLDEHRRQRDGTTDQERVRRLGAGRNAEYVLSGSVQRLGTLNIFATDILNINGNFIDGHEELYTDFSQGFEIIPRLAVQLGGMPVAVPTTAQTVINSISTSRIYNIGDTGPAGGLIFYDKGIFSHGWRYLEAAPAETEFTTQWGGPRGLYIPGTVRDVTAIGSGKQNTQLIVNFLRANNESGSAAQQVVQLNINGFTDWFLPSPGEVVLMFRNLKDHDLGGLGDGIYWTSAMSNLTYGVRANSTVFVARYSGVFPVGGNVHMARTSVGSPGTSNDNVFSVRAVRAF